MKNAAKVLIASLALAAGGTALAGSIYPAKEYKERQQREQQRDDHGDRHDRDDRDGRNNHDGRNDRDHWQGNDSHRDDWRRDDWRRDDRHDDRYDRDDRYHRDNGRHYGWYDNRPVNVVRLPPGYARHYWQGNPYYYQSGRWYRPWGTGYVVAPPPYGLFVGSMNGLQFAFRLGGVPYYRGGDTYFRYDDGRRGYVVVQPPRGW